LVASAKRDGMRLISVVTGTQSESARASSSQKLLSYGFRYYYTHKLYNKGDVVNTAEVWKGKADKIHIVLPKDIYLTVPRGSENDLQATVHIDEVIKAPILESQELGNIVVTLDDEELLNVPVVALTAIEEAGAFSRMVDSVKLFFGGFFSTQ